LPRFITWYVPPGMFIRGHRPMPGPNQVPCPDPDRQDLLEICICGLACRETLAVSSTHARRSCRRICDHGRAPLVEEQTTYRSDLQVCEWCQAPTTHYECGSGAKHQTHTIIGKVFLRRRCRRGGRLADRRQ
jgi:hypothetical protein